MEEGQTEPKNLPKPKELKPKGIPYRCPVCNGFGTLKYGSKTCQACSGTGYILVPIEEEKDETPR